MLLTVILIPIRIIGLLLKVIFIPLRILVTGLLLQLLTFLVFAGIIAAVAYFIYQWLT